jgi:AcrR family transcriptional regulator
MPEPRRRYELKERARRQEETRQRIVDATVGLHREVGPAKTTVTEVARRAGVSRLTVYKHFPSETDLFGACAAQFGAESPPPDPATWAAIGDPDERLRTALGEQYAWFRANESMLAHVMRDAALLPELAEVLGSEEELRYEQALRDALLAGRGLRGARRRRVAAAIGLALAFSSWQHLVRVEEVDDDPAIVDLMAGAVAAASAPARAAR